MSDPSRELLSRRALMARTLTASAGLMGARLLAGPGGALASTLPTSLPGGDETVASLLPSPRKVRESVARMVNFGPRLTGSRAHNRYIAWLQAQFTNAGCTLLSADEHPLTLWQAKRYGLEVLGGATPQIIPVSSYYPRSGQTSSKGVTGRLTYLGAGPPVSISPGDPGGVPAAVALYETSMESWLSAAIAAAGTSLQGAVVLIDLPLPLPLTTAIFAPMADYDYDPEEPAGGFTQDYKRLWITNGVGLEQLKSAGAAGVIFTFDASAEAMLGQYTPFSSEGPGLPALNVDRDTANTLRGLAAGSPTVRLTLYASREPVTSPSIVAVLPGDGSTDEVMVVNTHTDGQNFVEENGGVAEFLLARYFNALPKGKRLKRTLVFSAVTGHMAPNMPQTQGFIEDHPEIIARTVAAITLEHLGVSKWLDTLSNGYYEASPYEPGGAYCSTTEMVVPLIESIPEHQINNTAVLHGPVYFGIGGAFFEAGIPAIGYLTGPNYLVQITPNGSMDKLNDALFARQVAWFADLLTRYDKMSAQELRTGEPTVVGA
ncbi:MAG: hypothetical protein JWO23_1102 [Solirubrobacterales bacterium]|nr:hypothetical protein [Solirubrobacterales bacterium]